MARREEHASPVPRVDQGPRERSLSPRGRALSGREGEGRRHPRWSFCLDLPGRLGLGTPALQLEQGRLARDVEIQKGIYLTLKQQYELAKIEEVQESSIVQVLDRPQISLHPSNKKENIAIKLNILMFFIIILVFFENLIQ